MARHVLQWSKYAWNLHRKSRLVKLAEAYGIKGIRVEHQDDLERAINEANKYDGPVIVDFVIEKVDYVYPMIPAGGSVDQLIEEEKK